MVHIPKAKSTAIATLGVDIGKNTFHLVGLDKRGAIVLRERLSRAQIEVRLANLAPCLVGMEACVGAHHLGRRVEALGHDVRLMAAKYVRPFCRKQKNDFNDAQAIAEAVTRPTVRHVALKTPEQLDLQALHRVRQRLISQRTGVINQIRAFLLERGLAIRQGWHALRAELPRALSMTDRLTPRMLHIVEDLAGDWRRLDERIEGPIISSATVAGIGKGDVFEKGRDFAAWLGLVPKQTSTGGRPILGRISKRGNRYLRQLFVQASRVVLLRPQTWERYGLKHWIDAAAQRLHYNKLAVALANKLARIAWGVLHSGRTFETRRENGHAP
jgi:transposase